jgi:hypothetical protein
MTPAEHYDEAERLLSMVEPVEKTNSHAMDKARLVVKVAHVHALLATYPHELKMDDGG